MLYIYVPKKRATRATKHTNPLLGTGFMRSTSFFCLLHCLLQKRWMCCWALDLCVARNVLHFSASVFSDADNIHHPSISMYAISRTIQNPSFNTPYDVTMSIKYQTCKIMRFSQKSSLYTIFWCYTATRKKIIPTRFRVGILFTYWADLW